MNNKLILFGAGNHGILALEKYGSGNVAFFCDNATEKQGTYIQGIKVIAFEEMLNFYNQGGYVIMVTPAASDFLIEQLEWVGISNYIIFHNDVKCSYIQETYNLGCRYERENMILRDFVKRTSELNLLEDVTEFAKLSAEALRMYQEENLLLNYRGYQGVADESHFYGNMRVITQYAGINNEDIKYFPIVSHFDCVPINVPAVWYKSAVITSGVYFRRRIHERMPYVPVFSVGPYIHYAKSIYDENTFRWKKENCGKMLLAFLPHSGENDKRILGCRKEFVDSLVKRYKNQFQNIWLCVYWADINNFVCEYAESKGIHVVTAGFRWDEKFNDRLKTIMDLCDAVVCGDIGTFISYALYMGKLIGRVDYDDSHYYSSLPPIERARYLTDDRIKFQEKYYQLFNHELKINEEQKHWMNDLAGFDQIRNIDYIKNISEISKDVWMQCEGDFARYPDAVRNIYSEYDKNSEIDKMVILREAVGAYVV